jgi:hypothetical protein
MAKKQTMNEVALRYGLTGGALGLYFGLFFRPVREPSLWLVVVLAASVALLMLLIRAVRERPSFVALLKGAGANFVKTAVFLTFLELRHPLYAMGGRTAVVVALTLAGAAAGLWYAYEQTRS